MADKTSFRYFTRILGQVFCQKCFLEKKLVYYKIRHLDDPCPDAVAVNPKKYIKKFGSENINKKHRGMRKGAKGMHFEN